MSVRGSVLVPTALGAIIVTVSARLPSASSRLPLLLCARYCAPATGMPAVIELVDMFSTSTNPGGWPVPGVTGAVATAAKPVTLSGATTMLWVNPGSEIEDVVPEVPALRAMLMLLTVAIALFEALKTAVNLLLGNKTIIPGCGLVAETETTLGEIRSNWPSTTFRTPEVLAPLGNRGLETKTWTRIVAGFATVGDVPVNPS